MKVAVLTTVHNRRALTLRCLESLFGQKLQSSLEVKVFLVDDGSTDGTYEAVRQLFPQVRLVRGNGELYWNRGMRLAWDTAAAEGEWDAYLWLNDDVELLDGALEQTCAYHSSRISAGATSAVLVGTCQDPFSGIPSYGGVGADWFPAQAADPITCVTMNGNYVWIPDNIFKEVGNLSAWYSHAYGDFDYGFRVRELGFKILVLPGSIGKCVGHGEGDWSNPLVKLSTRWRLFHAPTGVRPKDFFRFKARWFGYWSAILHLLNAYRRMLCGVKRR